ncbi:MAG: TauD/TfdA family dioxygenase [Rhodobacteraceae bacterium]|nr:TauD/TfdA family dioxygenase [Paracoccaceae bacterium]
MRVYIEKMIEHPKKQVDMSQFDAAFDLEDKTAYVAWRRDKLAHSPRAGEVPVLGVVDLSQPAESEKTAILAQISESNFAIYQAKNYSESEDEVGAELRRFSEFFGLRIAEAHRSAGKNGVVALKVSLAEHQRGFIPYSRKAMNWHTDGYYNSEADTIRAFVLHCVRQADIGGQSQIIDNEIAYIRLRDAAPEAVALLMDPQAMTIPESPEADGSVRPVSIGPVFFIEDGKLIMRYTARTRSISWKNEATRKAAALLQELLEGERDYLHTLTLQPGQGILNNNTLHNRTAFDPNADTGSSQRMLYRIRFHNRL